MFKPQPVNIQSSTDPEQHQQEPPGHPVPPSEFVYQLILEQFWGDGVSKREIRSVYTVASDANAACQDYLLRTWPRDQFSFYEISASPQRPELSKVSALINGDRFHVWIEQHSWEGTLDFSSTAIAKRAGKGPNAYILQRTIKDASGGKRRSTTRRIFATRQLAKQALAQDEPPSEWSSNQGYVLEPGGEYAHALSPSGKTAWLFIEVRPLYMSYTRLEQELQEVTAGDGTSVLNPISLDNGDDSVSSVPASPTSLSHPAHHLTHHPRSSLDNPFSPMPSNPDEAGAFVYLVLQLKTIPYTPPILTVEAVAYEIEVANRFGIGLLEGFGGPGAMSAIFREDGCLQGSVTQRTCDEGLTVWVEKRAVVLGDEAMDSDLMSEHGSVQLNRAYQDSERSPHLGYSTSSSGGGGGGGGQKREEPADGFDSTERPADAHSQGHSSSKLVRVSRPDSELLTETKRVVDSGARYTVVSVSQPLEHTAVQASGSSSARVIVDSSEDLAAAIVRARVEFYSSLAGLDIATVDIRDELEGESKERVIRACSRSNPSLVLQETRVEDRHGQGDARA
ncbi:hypothetical protein BC939DRAFT_450324 [Gamsiella multidivaricata]|uniref:uncharacterized protein n=1 Tax=Gamsiella multidivaricata TaxID=101098 RepID=UPI00222051E8|nr:uncharacterized protein BC939DRAFT_450324 [Gamsiella multidivaricata]KAG0363017.1 hypothetical protein BGZ54_008380 [Gamsiella multidivaricata]KAI7824427.1 hypothetical protein BC939DRAFT_450324 [Gamsiella multidivaricata]